MNEPQSSGARAMSEDITDGFEWSAEAYDTNVFGVWYIYADLFCRSVDAAHAMPLTRQPKPFISNSSPSVRPAERAQRAYDESNLLTLQQEKCAQHSHARHLSGNYLSAW